MFYKIARPFLFSLDAEAAHDLTLTALQRGHDLGIARWVAERVDPLPLSVMGLSFPNPVGLAAGLDKTAAHIDALGTFGFGFIEAGTVTPRPQPGNAKPRMFRLPQSQALINRMGFNNEGAEQFVANVHRQHQFRDRGGIVGLNIGKNADTPIEQALDDYRACLRRVYDDADYVAVNVSSPNTKELRSLQSARQLSGLLNGLTEERKRLEDRHGKRVPIAVKIAPDLADESVPEMADQLVEHKMDAVIATNTTIARDRVSGIKHAMSRAFYRARPLAERATKSCTCWRVICKTPAGYRRRRIMSGADAVRKNPRRCALVRFTRLCLFGATNSWRNASGNPQKANAVASSPSGPTRQRA